MKKKFGITIGALAGAAVIGWFGMQQTDASSANPKISTNDVEQMVTDQYDGTITELELEKKRDKAVYEIEVQADGVEYDLIMDADSGEIIAERQEEIDDDKFVHHKESNQVTVKADQDDDSENKDRKQKENRDKSEPISIERAKEVALNKFEGKVTELELDEDDGRLIYEIEIRNGDKEVEMEIDAHTEELLELEIDNEEYDD